MGQFKFGGWGSREHTGTTQLPETIAKKKECLAPKNSACLQVTTRHIFPVVPSFPPTNPHVKLRRPISTRNNFIHPCKLSPNALCLVVKSLALGVRKNLVLGDGAPGGKTSERV